MYILVTAGYLKAQNVFNEAALDPSLVGLLRAWAVQP